ncbi:MAG: T9SS type A sorting domain-containing protein [Bacteroidota bacterium]
MVYNWTGSLATGAAAVVDLPQLTAYSGSNTLTINIVQPNGGTDANPADNTASTAFDVNIYIIDQIILTINTDNYGYETSWEVTNEAGTVVSSGGNYEPNEEYTETLDLPLGCYTFTIFDEYSDGMCCEFGNGGYELAFTNGDIIATGGNFSAEDMVGFKLEDEASTGSHTLQSAVGIYPTPSNGVFTITVNNGLQPEYTVYTLLGQQLTTGKITQQNGTLNLGNAASGVYLLKMEDKTTGATATFKLIKE